MRSRPIVKLSEVIGGAVGAAFAPLAAGASLARRARVFHPRGVVYRARVEPSDTAGPLAEVGQRLTGPAIVRLSGAIWKHLEHADVLGVAIRLRSSEAIDPDPAPTDQDLLLATFRSPWTLPLAPLATRAHDFFANDYYAVLPFAARPVGRIDLRLRSRRPPAFAETDGSRTERLARAVAADGARFAIELRCRDREPATWTEVAQLHLLELADIDQEALHFSPFRAGRGLQPTGFLQNLRRATYPASQAARDLATRLLHPDKLEDATRAALRPSTAYLSRRARPQGRLSEASKRPPSRTARPAHP